MRNSIAHGWRVAARTVSMQLGATVLVALAASLYGWRIGIAALVGGAIIAAGNGLFAMRLFGQGVTPARRALHAAYAAEVLKWFWLCVALGIAIAVLKLPFSGLIAGVLAAQFAFWIAIYVIR